MSGFFGFYNRDGLCADRQIAETMYDLLRSTFSHDKSQLWIGEDVCSGQAIVWNTPESVYDQFSKQDGTYVLAMDARVDNRDELIGMLDLPDIPPEQIGDSVFILAAYKKWRDECPKYLLGDFSFAIWDADRALLFCVRDHIGVKPFYYSLHDGFFVFSNDIETLLSHKSVSNEISDNAVATYLLSGDLRDPSMTFYKDIKKLPPATTLSVSADNTHFKTYWDPSRIEPLKEATEEQYAKELLDLLNQSIAARLRTAYPVAAHLSGGLDSSSIAVIASRLLKKQNETLRSFSWLHEPENPCDYHDYEWAYPAAIAKTEGTDHKFINMTLEEYLDYFDRHNISFGDTMQLWSENAVRDSAVRLGIRTMLSGWGGDELASYNGRAYYRNLFRAKKFRELLTLIWSESKPTKRPWLTFLKRLWRYAVIPQLPKRLSYKLSGFHFLKNELPYYVGDDFKETVDTKRILIEQLNPLPDRLELFCFGHLQRRMESWYAAGVRKKFEYRYPLLDKRIVEFSLGLPQDAFYQDGMTRRVFRKALAEILPSKILFHDLKTEPNGAARIHKDMTDALKLWKEQKMALCGQDIPCYVDLNRLLWMIDCSNEKKCYENNSQFSIGNAKELDIIQGILLYSAFKKEDRNDEKAS